LLGLLTIAVLALAVPASSLAAHTPKKLPTAKTTVKDKNGKSHKVTFQVTHVAEQNGELVADGYLYSATKGGNSDEVTPEDVQETPALAIPITQGSQGQGGSTEQGLQIQQLPPAPPGSCQILLLNLNPIHLDLLGLVLDTSNIDVRLLGVTGQGNLLGNLLCAVTGILDPDTGGGGGVGGLVEELLGNINAILEQILAGLG